MGKKGNPLHRSFQSIRREIFVNMGKTDAHQTLSNSSMRKAPMLHGLQKSSNHTPHERFRVHGECRRCGSEGLKPNCLGKIAN